MLDGAGRITDCMRRADGDLSVKRPVMPGLYYQLRRPVPGLGDGADEVLAPLLDPLLGLLLLVEVVQKGVEKNRVELDYLDSVLQMITLSEGDRDLQEIRQELMDNGSRRAEKAG